jgi:hypothetical protein
MAVTSRLYGTDIWTITTTDEAVKTNNWSKKKEYSRNTNIQKQLNIHCLNEKVKEYRHRWLQHIHSIQRKRIHCKIFNK